MAAGIDAIVAHASTGTCKAHLATLAAGYADGAVLRPYIPEASGNDALLVLPGADIAAAAAAIALGAFANAGQLCFSAKRIVVHRTLWRELEPALVDAVAALVIGDPSTPPPTWPAGSTGTRSVAEAAFTAALAAGGRLVVGGIPAPGETVPRLVLLPRSALGQLDLWRREIFAPIRGIALVEDAVDAVALANDTPFGIGVSVFGGQGEDHRRIGDAVRVARLLINESPLYQDPHLVVGGVGDSGYGGARPKLEQLVYARRVHTA